MFILVTGGSASGKSEYAEQRISELQSKHIMDKYYIATMEVKDEESKQRVKKHQNMRKDKHFTTIECALHLEEAVAQMEATISKDHSTVVLLECLSNLVANEMFSQEGIDWNKEISADDPVFQVADRIQTGLEQLIHIADHIVIVTNEVFSDGIHYDPFTIQYMRELGHLNQWLSSCADEVYEVVYGCPIAIKKQL